MKTTILQVVVNDERGNYIMFTRTGDNITGYKGLLQEGLFKKKSKILDETIKTLNTMSHINGLDDLESTAVKLLGIELN